MVSALDFLSLRHKPLHDYIDFYALSGEMEVVERDRADIALCGQSGERGDEVLYRTPDTRWVLVYAPYQDDVNEDPPLPPNRELSRADVARWFRLNEKELPEGLEPAPLGGVRGGQISRLDRNWSPESEAPVDATKLTPAIATPSNSQAVGKKANNAKGSPAKLKPPSKLALQVYRLSILQGRKQAAIADELSKSEGRPISQGVVSRCLKTATKWIEAGNVLPELPHLTKEPKAMAPDALDRGARIDRHAPRQRSKRDD